MNKIIAILFFVVLPGFISGQGKYFGGNGDGFATATINNQVLPLVIESFQGHLEKDGVVLNFTITGDELICGIVIEKSREGTIFSRIGSTDFQGGAYTAEKVTRQDNAVLPGNNYYRLRIVKCNGAYIFSRIIIVNAPVRSMFYYSSADRKLYYYLRRPGNLQVYSNLGQLMITKKLEAGSGSIMMDMPSTGLYFYRFAGLPGGKFLR